jgi:hypothetical protein
VGVEGYMKKEINKEEIYKKLKMVGDATIYTAALISSVVGLYQFTSESISFVRMKFHPEENGDD